MGRHGTREDDVDRLLRGGVLVDLYGRRGQGVRASVESYSIKRLEPLYRYRRAVELKDATSSIVAFEEWLQLADTDRRRRRSSTRSSDTTGRRAVHARPQGLA